MNHRRSFINPEKQPRGERPDKSKEHKRQTKSVFAFMWHCAKELKKKKAKLREDFNNLQGNSARAGQENQTES